MYTVVHDGEILVAGVEADLAKEVVRGKSNDWGRLEVASFNSALRQWIPVPDPLQFANAT